MSAKETHMEIRHLNNLRISLILAWYFPLSIFAIIIFLLFKEILFLSLENMLRDILPSATVALSTQITILFIYNEVMLKPLFMRCRGGIHDYRLKYEVIDFLWRWILWATVMQLISSCGFYLVYSSEVSKLGLRIFTEFIPIYLIPCIVAIVSLLILILFLYLWGAGANHIDKDKFENWLETDFPSFPIKSGIIFFILSLTGVSFWAAYIYFFINPGLLRPTLIISISDASFYLALSLLYYYLIKRIIGGFLEKHDTLLL